jgi:GTP-binding protein EngB required for normal cell division
VGAVHGLRRVLWSFFFGLSAKCAEDSRTTVTPLAAIFVDTASAPMPALLDQRTLDLLDRQRGLLRRLADALAVAGLEDDARRIRETADGLSETFLVVIVGEFNSGKSTLINALFGEELLEVGPIPTTAKITLVRHGEERLERHLSAYLDELRLPSRLLEFLTLVDTPGTNSIIEEHQQLTEDFVPRADLVLFVTSYERPLAGSEREFLRFLRTDWGKQFACVINKADQARSPEDLQRVIGHVQAGIEDALGFQPRTFAVSAIRALEARLDDGATSDPGFDEFEAFVRETLTGDERLRLKLQAPNDAAEARLRALDAALTPRQTLLTEHEDRLQALVTHLDGTTQSLRDITARTISEVDALLAETERRGHNFFDATFRASNIRLLRDRDRFKEEFARQVLGDLDQHVEARIASGVDAQHQRALALWQKAITQLRESFPEDAPGLDRAAVLNAIEKESARLLARHDVREEARAILENARGSTDLAGYGAIGAAGLGVLSGVLLVTTSMDFLGGLGVLTAGALGIASLTVLPRERRRAQRAFSERIATLRRELAAALEEQFDQQATSLIARAASSMRPFEDALRDERDALARAGTLREEVRHELAAIRRSIAA